MLPISNILLFTLHLQTDIRIIKNIFHRKLAYMYKNNKSIINMISPTDFTIVEKFKFHFDKK